MKMPDPYSSQALGFMAAAPRTGSSGARSELWGETLMTTRFVADHVSTELIGTPEGWIVVARCERCGGQWEALMDLRGGPGELEELSSSLQSILGWGTAHLGCPETAPEHPFVSTMFELCVSVARDLLGSGAPVSGEVFAFARRGDVIPIRVDRLPAADEEHGRARTRDLAWQLHLARKALRARGTDVAAVAYMGEAASPEDGSDEVIVGIATPVGGSVRRYPIMHTGGGADIHPDSFSRQVASAFEERDFLKGLLAVNCVYVPATR